MEFWIPAVVVLDLLIVGVLLFIVLRIRQISSGGNTPVELEVELGRLKQLAASFEAKEREVKEALEKIKANHARLDEIIQRLEEALEFLHSSDRTEQPQRDALYEQARKMLKEGISQEEITKRLNISRSEVSLLATVEKMRKN